MATWNELRRYARRRWAKRRGRARAPVVGAMAAGMGLMYLLDPDRGARRRALVRDRTVHAVHAVDDLIQKAARDLACRTRGLVAELRAFVDDDDAPDEVLQARVRSKLGRVVAHPHAIDVEVQNGRVIVLGPILAEDVDGLLATVAAIPGVRAVEHALEVHASEDSVPALQSNGRPTDERADQATERWSPVLRIAAGLVGIGLLAAGPRRRGPAPALRRIAGLAILARAVANQSSTRLVGIGAGRHAVDLQKTFTVHAPVEDVFDLWVHWASFPRFMSHLASVDALGGGRSRWIAKGPLGLPVSWVAEVTELIPNRRIAWASEPESIVANEGVVQFDPLDDRRTRIDIRLAYNPPGGKIGHLLAAFFGADPKHAMDQDLVRFQSLIERGKTTAHGKEVRFADVSARAED